MIRPVILGLDPSTKLIGWGLTDMEGKAVGSGSVSIQRTMTRREDEEAEARVVPLDRVKAVGEAVREIGKQVKHLEGEVVDIAIEHPLSYRPRSKAEIPWVCGQVAQETGRYFGQDVHEYTDMQWKSIVGLNTPRDPDNRRKTLKADALLHHVMVENPWWSEEEMLAYKRAPGQADRKHMKTHIFVRAVELGYRPDEADYSQDAADAAMVSLAHWTRMDETAARLVGS